MIAREKRADLQIDSSTLMTMCTVVDNLYFILHQVNSQCHIKLLYFQTRYFKDQNSLLSKRRSGGINTKKLNILKTYFFIVMVIYKV
jgi:hypothetical protein